ncbi:hypothetical protein J1N35_024411 [Gossypium stocksii]|uniref:Uncharacterized protein n=1 Tax=Gossypium stocksii TaxID=47602 RepID=A0A9D3V5L4_9ROSI|nr:hypothetical protein J1N35_024411 [Gossypium stocksii]
MAMCPYFECLHEIGYEFDFLRKANAMERIHCFLYENNKKNPVLILRVLWGLVTRQVCPRTIQRYVE